MALNTTGLPEAYKRKELGTATKTDKDNITYAESKGYKLPEQVSSANSTEPTSPVNNPTKPVAINGAEYNTREKQQEAYTDIKPVGDTLYGVAKTPIVPNVIPQKDFDSTMSPEDLSTTEETANKMVDFNDKQVNNLNKAYQRQILGTATETDINNINYATEKGWQPAEAEEEKEITVKSDAVLGKADVNKSTTDQIFEKYSNVGAEEEAARQQAIKDTKLMEKGEAIAVAETLVNNYRTELQNQAIIDIKEEDAIRSKPILTAQIQGKLNNLSREQKLDTMILQNNYNNALVQSQIAQGNYDRAKEIVEETAEDTYNASMLQIEALKYKNEIEAVEADRLEANLEYERELSLNGYVHIKSADGLKGLNESDLFRDPVSGKIYKKPEADISQVININGRMKGIDSQGNVIRDFGSSSSGLSVSEQMALIGAGLTMDDDGNITRDTSSANATQIANAIKQIESNNNYEAKGASGEYGAYQFMPATWNSWSSDYANKVLGQSTRRLEQTPENQDAVAEFKIQQWLSQGLSPEQIAAKWNSGSEIGWENKIGVNKQGVAYNVPNYVKKFNQALGTKVGTGATATPSGGGGTGGAGGGEYGEKSDFTLANAYVNDPDNANLSPEQFKANLLGEVNAGNLDLSISEVNSIIDAKEASDEVSEEESKPETFTKDWWDTRIKASRDLGASVDDIASKMIETYDKDEINKLLKEQGFKKFFRGKEGELELYIKSILE